VLFAAKVGAPCNLSITGALPSNLDAACGTALADDLDKLLVLVSDTRPLGSKKGRKALFFLKNLDSVRLTELFIPYRLALCPRWEIHSGKHLIRYRRTIFPLKSSAKDLDGPVKLASYRRNQK